MAIKERTTYLDLESQGKTASDKELFETLNARSTNLSLRDGRVIPTATKVIEEEKLDPATAVGEKFIKYEDVNRRSHEVMAQHEDAEMHKKQRAEARKMVARTNFELFVLLTIIVLAGFFVGLLLYPQTELSELSRDNSNLRDQISNLKTQILDAEEHANGVTDMDTIRAQALALGMQDPNQNQVVNLPVPNNDSLKTVVTYNMDGMSDEVIEDSENALATYYQSHPES